MTHTAYIYRVDLKLRTWKVNFILFSASAEIRVCSVVIGDDKPLVKSGTSDVILIANRFTVLSN
jgi:hypothetical protein